MTDVMRLAGRSADALVTVRAYAGSDAINAVLSLLAGLEDQYRADLEIVSVETLVPLQTALKQVSALRRAIESDQYLDPKIL